MGKRRKKGRAVKRNPHALREDEDSAIVNAPHSFVIYRGKNIGKYVQDLTKDFRQVMEPFTASDIKARPKNVIKDFVHVAGLLKVSHLIMFTKTEKGPYLKIGRFPRGPTLSFKVKDYVLARDVRSSLKRQVTYEKQFENHALLIMNNFSGKSVKAEEGRENCPVNPLGSREIELMASVFQNMFPSINVTKVKVNSIRRCVLLNYDSDSGMVDFRHYTIKVVPVGVSRGVKKIVVQSKVPNLSRYESMEEYLQAGGGNASESEAEGDETSHVTLPQEVSSRGNLPNQQSAIRLVELGPRLTLEPIKMEEGLLDGEVLYHKLVAKTEEEKRKIKIAREKRKREKLMRRKEQERNVKRKEDEKRKHKERSLAGMTIKKRDDLPEGFKNAPDSSDESDVEAPGAQKGDDDDDDDAEWYRKEVGKNPDKDLFDGVGGDKKRKFTGNFKFNKRFKKDTTNHHNRSKSKFDPSSSKGKAQGSKVYDKKKKRPRDIFNSQGVGPDYNKSRTNKGPRVTAVKGKKSKRK